MAPRALPMYTTGPCWVIHNGSVLPGNSTIEGHFCHITSRSCPSLYFSHVTALIYIVRRLQLSRGLSATRVRGIISCRFAIVHPWLQFCEGTDSPHNSTIEGWKQLLTISNTSFYNPEGRSVTTTRRLRDREMLKRKKEEAQAKDTYQEQAISKRQRKTKGTGRGRRKQVKEPEPEPQPELEPEPEPEQEKEPSHELQHDLRQEEHYYETEAETKTELQSDVPHEHIEHVPEQEPLVHQEDSVPSVPEEDTADVTLLIHEDVDGHLPHETSSLLKDEEEAAVPDSAPATETPEVLAFPYEQEQVEHQYYTPLL